MGYQYWKYAQLEQLCNDAFVKFGFNEEESKIISDVLLMSDRIGIESHGMQRMYRYYKSIQKGMIKIESKGKVVFETPVSAVIDAEDGMGQVVGHKAMAMAIEKAKKSGIGMVRPQLQSLRHRRLLCQDGLRPGSDWPELHQHQRHHGPHLRPYGYAGYQPHCSGYACRTLPLLL